MRSHDPRLHRTRVRAPLSRKPLGCFIGLGTVILALGPCWPLLAEIEKTSVIGEHGIELYWWPKLPPLKGWHQDLDYSHHYGANALAPDGKSFAEAETVMYAKALYKPREPEAKSLEMLIANDREDFEKDNPGIRIEEALAISTADGKNLRSFTFVPKGKGNWERVAYGEEGEYYLIFTISSRSAAGYKSSLPSFEYLISQYREAP